MSDSASQTPPKGDMEKAEKYINQLVDLLNRQKIQVFKTDLKKFDPTSLKDHYTINLKDYQIEVSHSTYQDSDKHSYVMIFNNLKNISSGSGEKVILAYIYLTDAQFAKFKIVADRDIEARHRIEEEKRFNSAVTPIEEILDEASEDKSSAEPDQTLEKPNLNFSADES